jgi:hypothetical protein
MIYFRRFVVSAIVAAVAASSQLVFAQGAGLEQKLESQYTVTKATADHSDIVTAGSVLVLEKDGLLMYTTTTAAPPTNTYKDGKISQGIFGISACKWCRKIPGTGSAPNVDTRTFVAGEKFWVIKIEQRDDGVYFTLFSDPISDVRYYSVLKFPVAKGVTPDPDKMLATVGEVLKVQADDSGGDSKQAAAAPAKGGGAPASSAQASAAAPAAPASNMAPIAPPPPPADAPPPQPKTVSKGQTKDQVYAIFGQPSKIANLGTKEIDYYPDFKVVFVGGKVSTVE